MAASLSLDTLTSSTSTITVAPGKTLALGVGALTLGGIPITTGAQVVLTKSGNYTIQASDMTGKTSLLVLVDASSGTGATIVIDLPPIASYSTCSIHVISTATHGAGNKVEIKTNSPSAEIYTLWGKGDHCEFVSNGTAEFRTGNEYTSIKGQVTLNADAGMPGNTMIDVGDYFGTANWVVREDTAGWWNTTDVDLDIPAGYRVAFSGPLVVTEYGAGYQLRNGDSGDFLTTYMDSSYHYSITGGPSDFTIDFLTATTVTFWARNFTAATHYAQGAVAPNYVSQIRWNVIRRL